MTTSDRNDLVPVQEKLEWVTPKISLMVAEETDGNKVVPDPVELGRPSTAPQAPS